MKLQMANINRLRIEIETKINFTNESNVVHYKEVELKEIQNCFISPANTKTL